MSAYISNLLAKRRRLHQARTVCQERFGKRLRCAICGDKLRRWCQRDETLCHPLGCCEHPCHSHCMLARLGADQPMAGLQLCPGPGCDRQFSQLCVHRAWWGRSSGQQSLPTSSGLSSAAADIDSLDGEPVEVAEEAVAGSTEAETRASRGSGSLSIFRKVRRFLPSRKRLKKQQQQQQEQLDQLDPIELSLNSFEGECAICCCGISADAGVPNGCCHSFCFDCLRHWCQNSASCPMDRRPVAYIYRRPAGSAAFSGRHRVYSSGVSYDGSVRGGQCGPLESPPSVPHFSEQQQQQPGWLDDANEAVPNAPSDNRPRNLNANGAAIEPPILFLVLLVAIVTALFVRSYGSPNAVIQQQQQQAASPMSTLARIISLMKLYNASSVVGLVQLVILLALLYRPGLWLLVRWLRRPVGPV